MTIFTKTSLHGLIAILYMTNFATIAMEKSTNYPQLRLQKPAEEIQVITYYGMLTNDKYAPLINCPIKYATHSVHTDLNLPSTIKDPVVTFKVVENLNDTSNVKFQKVIPLKHTFNLNDGSLLTTVKRTGAQLYPNKPSLKEQQFLIKIVCAKNSILKDNSFALQRNTAQNNFYEDPSASIWVDEKDNIQELADAGILKMKETGYFMTQSNNGRIQNKKLDTFGHGPNGCSNKETLIKSIIDEKMPVNKNRFLSLRNREINGSFK
jgi:hypothetical protein